jgi:Leucine-rich repeat (LRR) protein
LPLDDRVCRGAGFPWVYWSRLRDTSDSDVDRVCWSPRALRADLAVAGLLFVLAGGWCEWRCRRRARWRQITVGDVLVLMLVVALPLAWWRYEQDRVERDRAFFEQHRFSVQATESRVPKILTATGWGPDWPGFIVVRAVVLQNPDPESLRRLTRFSELESLTLVGGRYGVRDLRRLGQLPLLRHVSFVDSPAALDVFDCLDEICHIRHLHFVRVPVRGGHLERLSALRRLQSLGLVATGICDEDLRFLRRLENLQVLQVTNEGLHGEGLGHLSGHLQLRRLLLDAVRYCPQPQGASSLRQVCLQDLPRLEELGLPRGLKRLVLRNTGQLLHGENPDLTRRCLHVRGQGSGLECEELEFWNVRGLRELNLDGAALRKLTLDRLPDLQGLSLAPSDATRLRASLTPPFVVPDAAATDSGRGSYRLNGDMVRQIGRLSSLRFLDLTGAEIADEDWAALGELTGLEVLSLANTNLPDAACRHLRNLSRLTSLNLSHTRVGDDGWQELRQLPDLQALILADTKITRFQAKGLPSLRGLDLTHAPLRQLDLEDLPEFQGMLDLRGMPLRRVRMVDLPNLILLSLADTHPESVELANLPELAYLDLSYSSVNVPALAGLGQSPQLGSLLLRGATVTDEDLRWVGKIPSLEDLDLEETCITDAGLAHLTGLQSLRRLNLTSTLVTDAGLAHLKGLSSLELLYLGRTEVSGSGLRHLAGLSSLYKLSLGQTPVSSGGLAALPILRSLVWLRLSDTAIDDLALRQAAKLPALQTLHLDGCPRVSDRGLSALAAVTLLQEVDARDTLITAGGAAGAFPAHRRVRVVLGGRE